MIFLWNLQHIFLMCVLRLLKSIKSASLADVIYAHHLFGNLPMCEGEPRISSPQNKI